MSSLVKLSIENFKQRYLQPDFNPSVRVATTKSKFGLELGGGVAIYVGGKSNGEPVAEDGIIKAGETVQIMFGTIFPSKDNVLLSYNPALAEVANVSLPPVLEPEKQPLSLTFQARKQVDLAKFSYLIRVYLLE